MPAIETVEGVKISIFTHEHNPPHFHASYAESEELIIIETLETYSEKKPLPKKKRRIVIDWAIDKMDWLLKYFNKLNPQLKR